MIKQVSEAAIRQAAALLREGALVALPTETVYGLAADALNSEAVAQIYAVKNRPQFNPLIIHVADKAQAAEYVEFNPLAEALAARFWPGPLSLVLPLKAKAGIAPRVSAGLPNAAVRCPQGAFADIIRACGRPLAAPSANISGKISPTTAAAVAAGLGDKIPLIIDGGACKVGVESTIIKVEGEKLILLRAGGLSAEEIEAAAGRRILAAAYGGAVRAADAGNGSVSAPGQLKSHYAPEAKLRLNAEQVEKGEALLAFGPRRAAGAGGACAVRNLSETGDMAEAAGNLFHMLAELDAAAGAGGRIAAEPIGNKGLGAAINDRLSRAAAERD